MSDLLDLIQRLRDRGSNIGVRLSKPPQIHPDAAVMFEAADAIAALVAENQRLRSTLETLAVQPPELWQANARATAAEAMVRDLLQAGREGVRADAARAKAAAFLKESQP